MNARGLKLLLPLICSALTLPALADDWLYTIRPGDELWSIAQTYCGSARMAEEIARHNGIADPTQIRAGERLRIPTRILAFAPSTAEILSIQGEVDLRRGVAVGAPVVRAQPGIKIQMGDSLITREGSALVAFADGSDLAIQPNSRVLFNKLTVFGPAGMVDTHLRFAYGRATSVVKPQNRGDRFRIETPEGIAAVRGTEFRVGYAASSAIATTETLTGMVSFLRSNASTDVGAGFGVAASAAGVVRESLLPAPTLDDAPAEAMPRESLRWQPVPGAERYWFGWARSDEPKNILYASTTKEPTIVVDRPPGRYLVSIRGISQSGIEGYDTEHPLNVLADAPVPIGVTSGIGGLSRFSWEYPDTTGPFFLHITDAVTQQTADHEVSSTQHQLVLDPGRYQWRVKSKGSGFSERRSFEVRPDQPTNLSTKTQRRNLAIAWDRVTNASKYRIEVTGPDAQTEVLETGETKLMLQTSDFGLYTVSVTALDNAMASEAATQEVMVSRRPWWLLVPALILLI